MSSQTVWSRTIINVYGTPVFAYSSRFSKIFFIWYDDGAADVFVVEHAGDHQHIHRQIRTKQGYARSIQFILAVDHKEVACIIVNYYADEGTSKCDASFAQVGQKFHLAISDTI